MENLTLSRLNTLLVIVLATPLPHGKRDMNLLSYPLTHENSIVDSRNILLFSRPFDK